MEKKIYKSLELLLSTDAYKLGHKDQYPEGTNLVYSNLTPRESKDKNISKVYVCGIKSVILEMHRLWKEKFFDLNEKEIDNVLIEYQKTVDNILGTNKYDVSHFKILWKEKSLNNVLTIKVLEDRTLVDFGVPILKLWNSNKKFYWLTNYLETYLLSNIWNVVTSSTKSYYLKLLLNRYAKETADDNSFVSIQAHDFSFRGLSSSQSAAWSGIGHLYNFNGSDNLLAVVKYNFDSIIGKSKEWKGISIPATEHSIMSSEGVEGEFDLYKRLLTLYKKGLLSIVSDTYDYYNVIDNYLPRLKEDILKRDGKVVIRPDSGNPLGISIKTIKKLWDIFGGTTNKKGYKVLDPHVGIIYGDGVHYNLIEEILEALKDEGFSSENIVFGVGANTYQKSTRDLLGFAMKATYIEVNGKPRNIFKDPKTDHRKKSAKGLLAVNNGILNQESTWEESLNDDMIIVK